MPGEPCTLAALYRAAREGMPSAFEAAQLFTHLTGRSVSDLPLGGEERQPAALLDRLLELCALRRAGHPLQYLLGEWEFYGLPFAVGPGVLIPRPETELLVDLALERAQGLSAPRVVDLCSGSGCVAVALAKHLPGAAVEAVERSPAALAYLERNVAQNRVAVRCVAADATTYRPTGPVDLIVSNPPYIPAAELPGLQSEVQREPAMALDGGSDGLDFYRAFAAHCPALLAPGGALLLEVGAGQHRDVAALLERGGLAEVGWRSDLAGIPRVVYGTAAG